MKHDRNERVSIAFRRSARGSLKLHPSTISIRRVSIAFRRSARGSRILRMVWYQQLLTVSIAFRRSARGSRHLQRGCSIARGESPLPFGVLPVAPRDGDQNEGRTRRVSIAFRRSARGSLLSTRRHVLGHYLSPLPFGVLPVAPRQAVNTNQKRKASLHCLSAFCPWLPVRDMVTDEIIYRVSIAFRRSARGSLQAALERHLSKGLGLHCLSAFCPWLPGQDEAEQVEAILRSPLPFGVLPVAPLDTMIHARL